MNLIKDNNMKFLIISPGGLGDFIMMSANIIALRRQYPDSTIHLYIEKRNYIALEALFSNIIDKFIPYTSKYNLVWNILKHTYNNYSHAIAPGKSKFIPVLLALSGAKYIIHSHQFRDIDWQAPVYHGKLLQTLFNDLIDGDYNTAPDAKTWQLDDVLDNNKIYDKYILIHPGVSPLSIAKNIIKSPDLEYWHSLVKNLQTQYPEHLIVLTGGNSEIAFLTELSNLNNQELLSLKNIKFHIKSNQTIIEFLQLLNHADVFICVDSAPLHLAIALQKHIYVIWGPTDEYKLIPPDSPNVNIIKIQKQLNCQPCLFAKSNQSCDQPICITEHNPHASEWSGII